MTVDVVSGADEQAVGEKVARRLADIGVTVDTVSDVADAATSSISYPDSEHAAAALLAEALGAVDLLRPGDGAHVTVVVGRTDASVLVEALSDFTGGPCNSATADVADESTG